MFSQILFTRETYITYFFQFRSDRRWAYSLSIKLNTVYFLYYSATDVLSTFQNANVKRMTLKSYNIYIYAQSYVYTASAQVLSKAYLYFSVGIVTGICA